MLQVIEFHHTSNVSAWLAQIGASDWAAGTYLRRILAEGKFHDRYGSRSRVLLLTEGDRLLSFCTYAEQDEIIAPSLTPWAGFLYTFPPERGRRRAGKLLEHAHHLARDEGHSFLYLESDEVGLYEKYGFSFWRTMTDREGHETSVFRLPVTRMDYSGVLGKTVRGAVDRPLGSAHPRHPELVYPVNYGYVDGVTGGDGAPQDAYILGADRPLARFEGTVIGVLHRLNDCEDKWVVSVNGASFSREAILDAIAFQEQYFMGELYTL